MKGLAGFFGLQLNYGFSNVPKGVWSIIDKIDGRPCAIYYLLMGLN